MTDLLIVGGGDAGLMAAGAAAVLLKIRAE